MDAIELIRSNRGLPAKITRGLGLRSSGTVSQWKAVPAQHVLDVERITGIDRHVLRPDLYPAPAATPASVSEERVG